MIGAGVFSTSGFALEALGNPAWVQVVIDKDADGMLERRIVLPVRCAPFTRTPD